MIHTRWVFKTARFAHGVLRASALDRRVSLGIFGDIHPLCVLHNAFIRIAGSTRRADRVRRGAAGRGRALTGRTRLARLKNRVRLGRAV